MNAGTANKTDKLLALVRDGKPLSAREQLRLAFSLSVPAVLTQFSTIAMQYIDAAMAGQLGAEAAASIGLVATSTWLFWGVCAAAATGFSVQVAHLVGAGNFAGARRVLRQSVVATFVFGIILAAIGAGISDALPSWLGGDVSIHKNASLYFLIFSLFLPALQLNFLAGGMLRCAGNMRVPSVLNALMCALDVVFNFLLIFPTREIEILGRAFVVPGAGLGVGGAALGTVLAEFVCAAAMLYYLFSKAEIFKNRSEEKSSFLPEFSILKKALRTGLPMSAEHAAICGAQIATTLIVAPLGVIAVASNAFAIIAESLCYMPGYGIAEAATTLVGQSIGAGRKNLARRFAWICVGAAMVVMGIMGATMFATAPWIIGVMSPDAEIRELGSAILRIESFAEPMFAAAIVSYGVFAGTGRTLVPCAMNFFSICCVRLTLATMLAPTLGLRGVWIAMCAELCFRGTLFLIRLARGKWLRIPDQKIVENHFS